jgi:16S rRNA processing protein RimM
MERDACFQLGYVSKTHGTNGQIMVQLDVDDPQHYKKLESIFLEIEGALIPFFIESQKLQGDKVIIKLEDIDSLPQAEELKGTSCYLPLHMLPVLNDDQFYYHEIIGFSVVDENRTEIGTVKEVYNLPQQDLLAVDHQGKEVLIPIVDDIVTKVNKKEKTIEVNLPEGLLDI